MKYLRLFENKTEDFFKDKINWNLVRSLKDLALTYLEENGQEMTLMVYSCYVNKGVITMSKSSAIYTCDSKVSFFYNQYAGGNSIDTYNKYHKLLYRFYISKDNTGGVSENDTLVVIDRIRKMYPNETIGGMGSRPLYVKKGQ